MTAYLQKKNMNVTEFFSKSVEARVFLNLGIKYEVKASDGVIYEV